jgi:hypothetical protein
MKQLLLLIFACCCYLFSNAQLPQTDTVSVPGFSITSTKNDKQQTGIRNGYWVSWYANARRLDSGLIQKGVADGQWKGWYKDGSPRFVRTYSAEKWQQFQHEKSRYHPKRTSLPITRLFHENKNEAEKYLNAINTFCAGQNCAGKNESPQLTVRLNAEGEHYHPVFEQGLLHGLFVNYFPGGAVKDSGNYKDGLPEGLWLKWTDDKKYYWKGYFQHGHKNKEWKLYTANDKLVRVVLYENGKLLWRKNMIEGVEVAE